jgi:pimeloyl-ACP methyl ester carboxylesterase
MTATTVVRSVRGLTAGLVPVFLVLAWAGPARAQADDRFPTLAADAPVGTGAVQDCMEDAVRCGVFRVWENRDAAAGRTLDLHFLIIGAADPGARTDDPIVFFNGGPGARSIPPAGSSVAQGYGPLRRTRDILLVDLRGIGLSGALGCDVPYPGGFDSRFGTVFATDHIAACRDTLSRRADLTQYTTPISVDDLEELRQWLGYGPMNLFGGSYGSRVAQVYMRRHPEAVRTAILNGVTPISEPGYLRTSPNLQRALDQVIRQCEAQPDCAAAYPGLDGMVEAAFARFGDGPVSVGLSDGRTVQFHAADLGYALRGLLYGRSAEVPYRIAQAAAGDFTELADYYVERTDWVSSDDDTAAGNHFSVICAEDIQPVTGDDVRRAAAGTFLRGHVILSYRAACGVWPEAELPADFFQPVRSDVPTLLLSGGRDPVTPPAGAETVAEALTNDLHVVVPNAGHGVFGSCIVGMILRLLEDGSLENIDTSCVSEAPAPEFRLP